MIIDTPCATVEQLPVLEIKKEMQRSPVCKMSDENTAESEVPLSNRLIKRMLKIVASVKKAKNDEPGKNVLSADETKKK
ncbi:hypothetical protein G9C98_003119, partial [Cotesia typhae]